MKYYFVFLLCVICGTLFYFVSCNTSCDEESDEDAIFMPLMDDTKAVLKAALDVSSLNKHLQKYIQKEIKTAVEIAMANLIDQKVKNRTTDVQSSLTDTINSKLSEISGDTYIRWGRTVCSDESTTVYDGYAAGNHHNVGGSGSNYLCLPKDPEWGNYDDNQYKWKGRLYGVQYAVHDGKPFSTAIDKKDMPCAVCQTTERKTVLMIPGKVSCPSGWTIQSSGYLMSETSTSRSPSEYICVDKDPETVLGAKGGDWEAAIYPVEVTCGRLPCPPYVNGRELSCVVCSK